VTDEETLLRLLDDVLFVIASREHPRGSSRLVLTFDELDFDYPPINGFSAVGFDRVAAMIRGDASLIGRPVFALDVAGTLRRCGGDVNAAGRAAAVMVAHELAHAVIDRQRPDDAPDTVAAYRAWLRSSLDGVAAQADRGGINHRPSHHPRWWRIFLHAVARMPRLLPCPGALAAHPAQYGYGTAADFEAWLDAVAAVDTRRGSLLEAADRPCPDFDSMLARTRPAATAAA
jgi:hypothetical protein